MAKAKVQPETPPQEKERTGLEGFIHHQGKAFEETGKALASLLPKEFRTHVGNAVGECRASFDILADGVIDVVESGLDRLRTKPKEEEEDTTKVKVEVE
jgi:hypothetical protein